MTRTKVKGISTFELTQLDPMDVMKMNEKELRQVVSRMADAANKRMKRFEEAGVSTPATRGAKKGGKFSTKGLDLNNLRSEYARARDFLTAETGTRKGWQKVQDTTVKSLNEKGVNIDHGQFDKFWKAYEKAKELDPSIENRKFKYAIAKEIANEMEDPDKSIDEIVQNIEEKKVDIYEALQEAIERTQDVSDFFAIT